MTSSPSTLPGLDLITSDLKVLVKEGIGSAADSQSLPTLSQFVCVREDMRGDQELEAVVAIERVVARAIESFEGTPSYEVMRLLFGVAPTTNGLLAKQRRLAAARHLGGDPATFNRHDEPRLLRPLARRLYGMEADTQLRRARLGTTPREEDVEASWMSRFVHYNRMADLALQLQQDLIAVLLTYSTVPDETGREDYLDASIWRYGHLLLAHERFCRELGGLWLMPDPDVDTQTRSAIELVLWHGPFNERGRSWLRVTLSQTKVEELFPFARQLHDVPESAELIGLWEQWLESCRCDPERPEATCRPHQVIGQCERLGRLVEEQWTLVRDAYRSLPDR